MTLSFLILLAVLVVGISIAYSALRRSLRAELNELRTMLDKHIQSTAQPPAAAQPEKKAIEPQPVAASKPQPAAAAPAPAADEIPPEVLAVIAAAVAHFCGVDARIRSARLTPSAGTSAWAQWGRASIQASHNLPAQRAHA